MRFRISILIFRPRLPLLAILPALVSAQAFIAGLGGTSALSNAAGLSTAPEPAISRYDSQVGPALNVEAGYHWNNWFSWQGGYVWNRNRILTARLAGSTLKESQAIASQHALSADLMLFFRSKTSVLRPYLSFGPAWVRFPQESRLGLRTAVGIDYRLSGRWSLRYTFSEMISGNPFAQALNPPSGSRLMNFQNFGGIVRTF